MRAQRSFLPIKITQAEQMIEAYKRGIDSKRTLPQESVKALIDIYRKNVVGKVNELRLIQLGTDFPPAQYACLFFQ
jgi:hypothetical protein